MLYVNLLTMAPSCWKDFIYIACCCLGDEYLDEIDEYNKQQNKERESKDISAPDALQVGGSAPAAGPPSC